MPFTQTDLNNLDATYAQGLRVIKSADGKELQFNSVDDYIKLRNLMRDDIAATGPQPIRQVRIFTTNGWGC